MPDDADDLMAVFLEEAAENLTALEQGLLCLDRDPSDRMPLDAVFRAAHSIKGGSSFFGLQAVTRLAHAMENVLDRARSGEAPLTRRTADLLLRSADALGRLLADTRTGAGPTTGHEGLVAELHQSASGKGTEVAGATPGAATGGDAITGPTSGPAAALGEYLALLEGIADWQASVLSRLRGGREALPGRDPPR